MMTALLSGLSLIAFAANSILCRLALKSGEIGPMEFTSIRLISGSLVLLPIFLFKTQPQSLFRSGFKEALALFAYALFFSLAYVRIEAGAGALMLFAAVQITMIGISLFRGHPMSLGEWFGFGLTFSGLVYMLSPGLQAPPLVASLFMVLSGVAWGLYSVWGQAAGNPFFATARNFLWAAPLGLILLLLLPDAPSWNSPGMIWAILSGALTSGLGYMIWYIALQGISLTTAALLQLSVPLITALGGVILLQESIDIHFILSAILILGGIVLTLWIKKQIAQNNSDKSTHHSL